MPASSAASTSGYANTKHNESSQNYSGSTNSDVNKHVNTLVTLPAMPFHPLDDFTFPKTGSTAGEIRLCHAKWFKDFTWLHYSIENDFVLCHVCCSAVSQKLVSLT